MPTYQTASAPNPVLIGGPGAGYYGGPQRYKFGHTPSAGENPASPGNPLPGWYVGGDGKFHPIRTAAAEQQRQQSAANPAPTGYGASTYGSPGYEVPAANPPGVTVDSGPSGGGGAGGGNDAVTSAIQALAEQMAASREQQARDAANQAQAQQAFQNSQVGIGGFDAQTNLLNTTLQSPRANFMSQFLLRGDPSQSGVATPGLAALLRRQNIPNSGNIPGSPLMLRPEETNTQALMQAFQGATQPTINSLAQDPIERETLGGWAGLLGLNPDAFWRLRSPMVPNKVSLTPNFMRL